jgi:hypothetical protein
MQVFALAPLIVTLATVLGAMSALLIGRVPISILQHARDHGRFVGLGSGQNQKRDIPAAGTPLPTLGALTGYAR